MSQVVVVAWGQGEGEVSVGGLGGWVSGHKWSDYLERQDPRIHHYFEAIRASVIERNLRESGYWHQRGGEPIFSDGTYGAFSFRGWGDLLAAIWNTEEGTDAYSYMDFYC